MPETPKDPPLVDVKVTNPITYIKNWWAKIIGNEGMEFRFRVRPLTAIAIAVIISSIAFGVGKFVLPFSIPFFSYRNDVQPLPTSDPWRETAFTGTLQYTAAKNAFYLITTSSAEAITLEVPENINLKDFVGQRIFAAGKYNRSSRVLIVSGASSLEVLPKKPVIIPTSTPSPTPVETPTSPPTPSPTPIPASE